MTEIQGKIKKSEKKGKNLEEVVIQMKKDSKDPKRESKRSLLSFQYRMEINDSISVNDVLDKLIPNKK